ncbi:colicin-B [Salmonella enterica subsp. enterica serovar Nima]|uniref:Colicin-B n=1 Tax=Salmonella enterica subsp. salamae serovar 48:d:z6 TaxID=1151170 RepID=A0A729JUT3_SALER|nr:colicin-B [Salmonella enterica subsp. enterica serovar Vitkin]EBV3838415.1 colicin-B [Salmonella enterica subsp. enterica serovar Cotham]ECD3160202.1 colicin-B [Salmonella enterica subsp. enterica serovar Monschaui]ECF3332088.1 colicin-B [Salmonella enterica subsp. enterica serovar Nima]EDR9973165.1 colicin-B [Salmonella enterica subsp. houtenae]HAC6544519.1 colicin-B [Salmonella enterica subsp. salamae serovar 48:d:z6]
MFNTKDKNKKANQLLYIFSFIGIIPLIIIFTIYINNSQSPILHNLYIKTESLHAITSAYNPVMTKLMATYNKSAPILGIVLFICSFKLRELNKKIDKNTIIKSCFFGPIFYAIYIYITIFYNLELTASRGFFRMMAYNNFALLILYTGIYFTTLTLTYSILLIPLMTFRFLKGRQ